MKKGTAYIEVDVKDELPEPMNTGFKESIDVLGIGTAYNKPTFGYFNLRNKAFYSYHDKAYVDVTHWLKKQESVYVLTEQGLINLLNNYKEHLLKEIARTFLKPSNQDKADKETDKHVFQAIGESIEHFPYDTNQYIQSL